MKRKSLFSLAMLFVFVLTFSFVFTVNVMAGSEPEICCGIDATPYCSAGIGKWIEIPKDPGSDWICIYLGVEDCEWAPECF